MLFAKFISLIFCSIQLCKANNFQSDRMAKTVADALMYRQLEQLKPGDTESRQEIVVGSLPQLGLNVNQKIDVAQKAQTGGSPAGPPYNFAAATAAIPTEIPSYPGNPAVADSGYDPTYKGPKAESFGRPYEPYKPSPTPINVSGDFWIPKQPGKQIHVGANRHQQSGNQSLSKADRISKFLSEVSDGGDNTAIAVAIAGNGPPRWANVDVEKTEPEEKQTETARKTTTGPIAGGYGQQPSHNPQSSGAEEQQISLSQILHIPGQNVRPQKSQPAGLENPRRDVAEEKEPAAPSCAVYLKNVELAGLQPLASLQAGGMRECVTLCQEKRQNTRSLTYNVFSAVCKCFGGTKADPEATLEHSDFTSYAELYKCALA